MMLLFCDRLVKYSGWFWGYISPIQERQALPIIPNPAVESSAESKLLVFRLKASTKHHTYYLSYSQCVDEKQWRE
jgi:hypothetical protein